MKRNLLDTHTLIWFLAGDPNLSKAARNIIESENSVNFISMVSFWEIAIKISLGKLFLKTSLTEFYNKAEESGFKTLPLSFKDTLLISTLPFHHKDPFDRMILAQAMNHKLIILSRDSHFADYGVPLLW